MLAVFMVFIRIADTDVPKNAEYVSQYKVLIPRSGNPSGSIFGKPKISEPNSCSSNTYVVVIAPNNSLPKSEAQNMITYIQTKLFRFLVAIKT